MCIVIDINTISMVFSETNENHPNFSPVKTWILSKKGFIIYGGSKYKLELSKTPKYMRLFRIFRDAGHAIPIVDSEVDNQELRIKNLTTGSDCNDEHIIALLGASHCSLLCSGDKKSFDHIKDRRLYSKQSPRVSIYTSIKNKDILKKSNIGKIKNIDIK